MTRAVCTAVWAFAMVDAVVVSQDAGAFGHGAVRPGSGVENPVVVRTTNPTYPRAALDARVQGDVELEIVVRADGTVGDVRVVRSADKTFGLDDAAVMAAREWVFKPGTVSGQPVAVIQRLLESFGLSAAMPAGVVDGVVIPVDDEFAKDAYRPGRGVRQPVLLTRASPAYTRDAMRQKIQGEVALEALVEMDGRVGAVRVMKSLDAVYGLDDAAMAAARRWTFQPGTLNGQPVRVIVKLVLEFRLH